MKSGATLSSPPVADPVYGIRQFTVGTGGENHHGLSTPLPTSEVRTDQFFGILKLTLRPTGYDWNFLPVAGDTFTDSGTGTVHGPPSGIPTCYALTLSHTGQGSDPVAAPANSAGCSAGQYLAGESISLSGAVPTSGWQISNWTGTTNNASTAGTNSVTMPAGVLTASVNYTLIPSPPADLVCTVINPKPETATTGEKPQSKVWNFGGSWYSVFPTSAAGASSAGTWLWKLNGTTWTEVLKLSTRTDVLADAKVLNDKVHVLLYAGTNTELVSVEFYAGNYQLWTGRPTPSPLSLSGSEIATIDIDSTGRMWLVTETDAPGQIIAYSSDSPYTTWSAPITLASGIAADDIAVVTKLPGKIGVLWSNQNTQRFGFRVHNDADAPGTWGADEVPASQSAQNAGLGMADDHMNVKVATDGTLYAAVKTSYDLAGYPKLAMLVRRPAGTWDDLYTISESGTRANIELDETAGVLTYVYTQSEGNNPIVYRQSNLAPISFGAVKTLRSQSFNDVSSTKQNYNGELVVIYSNGTEVGGQVCGSSALTYSLTANTSGSGTVTKNPDLAAYSSGSNVELTATPAIGWTFSGWSGDASGVTNPLNVTMSSNKSITANFTIVVNTITASAGANGSISPSGAVPVNYGADQTFTITPNAYYHIVDVVIDGVTNLGPVSSHTFTNVTSAHTIAANFAIDLWAISGNIKDSANVPLQNVIVAITGGSPTSTDSNGNYSFTGLPAGGTYTVTPTGAGYTFEPISRTYSSLLADVSAADFVGFTGSTPRAIKAVSQNVAQSAQAFVPVTMVSQGNENSVAFSLAYDPTVLSSPSVVAGDDCTGCVLAVVGSAGQLGVTAVRTGNSVFTVGTRQVVRITFNTTATGPAYLGSALTFGDAPTVRKVANASADPFTAAYTNGFVTFALGNESRLTTRYLSDYSGQATATDYVQAGNFAAGILQPDPLTNEFQRADSAPRATRGDGLITAADYVQAGRYAAGIDNLQPAGGTPFASLFSVQEMIKEQEDNQRALLPRVVSVIDTSGYAGQQVVVSIKVDANGDESGFGFTVSYDGTKLSDPFVMTGADMPFSAPIVNTMTAGKVGVITASQFGATMPFGSREIVKIRFNILPTASGGPTSLAFTGAPPVVNQVSSAAAEALPTTFTAGTLTILAPTAAGTTVGGIVLSPGGQAVRNARLSMTDQSGMVRTVVSNSFGFFRFDDVTVGETYVIDVRAKGLHFAPQVVSVADEITDLIIVAEP
ncbi:MAG: carboxypeptidase regulatory-like domain-containing protein [Chloracidobacterium sp.]|nr:carboxypeptidase regulatory-like domain-containing protein [Chloracidobacterium sp.]